MTPFGEGESRALEPSEPRRAVAASVVIAGVLLLQGVQTLAPHKRLKYLPIDEATNRAVRAWVQPPAWYPFFDYPMYSRPHYPGEGVPQYRLLGRTAGGDEVVIDAESLRTTVFALHSHLINPLRNGDLGATRPFVAQYERMHGVELVELRLENAPVVIGREGVRQAEPRTETVVDLDSDPSDLRAGSSG